MNCPFCHDSILDPATGVQCRKCSTAHHRECWDEYTKCTIQGCESREHGPMKALSAARRAIAIGRSITAEAYENAREHFGGKTTVLLFMLSSAVAGLGAAPLLYAVHASAKVDVEVVLGGLFLILATWITVMVYRGGRLEDDVDVEIAARSPADYYSGLGGSGSGGSWARGCDLADGCGSGGSGIDGALGALVAIVAIVVIVFVVLPFIAWLAVEVVFPLLVLVVYGTLYHALAFAVNSGDNMKGQLGGSLVRGVMFAAIYTTLVAVVLGAFVGAFHGGLPHRF